jgi:threonine dehydrogenase-like Zn-dependent dehydrogenase
MRGIVFLGDRQREPWAVAARGSAVTELEAPIGQRVVVHHCRGCRRCKYCRVGYSQLYLHGHLVYGVKAPR